MKRRIAYRKIILNKGVEIVLFAENVISLFIKT